MHTAYIGHLKSNSNKFPHRAFSLFLFNNKGEILLQQRSKDKITFPLMWTNTCCSHPLPEIEEEENIGVKKAAQRRVKFEMGIDINKEDLLLVDIVLYKAFLKDSIFEEYEVDHVLISKYDKPISQINFNKDEVELSKYLSLREIKRKMIDNENDFTPWFYNILLEKGDYMVEIFNKFFKDKESLQIKDKKNTNFNEFEKEIKLRKAEYTNL